MHAELMGLRRPDTPFVVFLLHSILQQQQKTEMKWSWRATLNAARAKYDARIAPLAAENGGTFG